MSCTQRLLDAWAALAPKNCLGRRMPRNRRQDASISGCFPRAKLLVRRSRSNETSERCGVGGPHGRCRPQLASCWLGLPCVMHGRCQNPTKWARQNPEGNSISRYYPNPRFEGFPLVRYDVGVAHDFGSDAPAKSMLKDGFSARWDTCVVVAKDVTVPLRLVSDDGSTLSLDGVPQMQIGPEPGQASAAVLLRAGLRHLSVEFVELEGMALVRLEGLELLGTDHVSLRATRARRRAHPMRIDEER